MTLTRRGVKALSRKCLREDKSDFNTMISSFSHDVFNSFAQFLDFRTFTALCCSCCNWKSLSAETLYWKRLVEYRILPTHYCWSRYLHSENGQSYRDVIFQTVAGLSNCLEKRIVDVIVGPLEVTSVDRLEECARNVIKPSLCVQQLQLWLRDNSRNDPNFASFAAIFQMRCGCSAQRPCYWSSKPSKVADGQESILFNTVTKMCTIVGFSITPYRAYFHPDNPVYNPLFASLQFFEDFSEGGGSSQQTGGAGLPYYETEKFPVKAVDEQQFFYFPFPILSVGGLVRLVLHGMAQRQTLETATLVPGDTAPDDYYLCLSRVNVLGIPIVKGEISLSSRAPHSTNNDETNDHLKDLVTSGFSYIF